MNYSFIDILNLDAKNIRKVLEALDNDGTLKKMLPELEALKGIDKTKISYHKDNFIHTILVVENTYLATTNPWIRLIAFLHDIGKAKTKRWIDGTGWSFHNHEYISGKMLPVIFKRLNLPLDKYDYVHKLIVNHGLPKDLSNNVTESALRRLGNNLGKDLEDLILFCKCDLTSKNLEKKESQSKAYDNVYNAIINIREKDLIAQWRCPITGKDIMNYFNFKQGREIGLVKNEIIDAIKSGKIEDSYESAYEYMTKIKI